MSIEVRGRGRWLWAVAMSAAALAVGYGWLVVDRGSSVAGWCGVAMVVIAAAHTVAAWDARQPRLTADEAGVRVRAGRSWFGLDWYDVERVDVRPAGRWSDGTVAVVPRDTARPHPDRRRDRWSLRRNRRRYDADLCVEYGLLTTMDVPDLPAALGSLAGDRLHVVGIPTEAPHTVEVAVPPSSQPDAGPSNGRRAGESGGVGSLTGARSIPLHSRRRTGRRTDLTIAAAGVPAASASVTGALGLDGSLALDPSSRDRDGALPEAGELRRAGVDNVSLIIDETTAVTARAMSRTRVAPAVAPADPGPDDLGPERAAEHAAAPGSGAGDPAAVGVGAALEHARTVLGVSVDDLAERTRIRPHVIECLERDDMSACGGDVYARGHLRMLAQSLGLDPQPLVERYDATFASEPIRVRDVFDAELSTTGLVRSADTRPRWDVLVAVVLVLVVGWTVARYLSGGAPADRPVSTGSHAGATVGPGVGSRLLPGPSHASATLRAEGGASRVVVVDRYGHRVFAGELVIGQPRHVRGVAPLEVRASDGSVVAMTVRGKNRGLLAPISTDAYGRHLPTPVRATVRASH